MSDASSVRPMVDFSSSFKEWDVDALVDRWFFRPVGELIVRVLLPTRIRPNQVSVASLGAGLLAGVCYDRVGVRANVAGALLLALSVVLDAVDGQLARRRGQASETGKLFDTLADVPKTIAVMFGLAFGMLRTGGWGPLPVPAGLSPAVAIWTLGWLAGLSMIWQVTTRNEFVATYRRIGKGIDDPTGPRLDRVREELLAMRARGGFWLERGVVPVVLWLSRLLPARPRPVDGPIRPGYVEAMRPYIRLWTFFGGATQFAALVVASLLGAPVWGWIFIGIVANVAYLPLLAATIRAHRRALG